MDIFYRKVITQLLGALPPDLHRGFAPGPTGDGLPSPDPLLNFAPPRNNSWLRHWVETPCADTLRTRWKCETSAVEGKCEIGDNGDWCHVYNLYYSTAPSGGLISLSANERQHERIITLVDGAVRAPSSWRCNDTLKN